MPNFPGKSHTRVIRRGFAGGLNVDKPATRLGPDESSAAENVEFDTDSLQASRGCLKYGNRSAPKSAVRTRIDPLGRLAIDSGRSVPVRGGVYIPYSETYDCGGVKNAFETGFGAPAQFKWHNQRGRSFERSFSFELPIEERLFDAPTPGPNSGYGVGTPAYGYDEALDEFTCILQKGGDRKSPMSWAIGIVNTGEVFETQTGASAADRPSNYALCFMWLDAAQWGHVPPSFMSYKTTSTTDLEADPNVEHSTLAYRAIVFQKFIEPGKRYHVSFQLSIDSGTFEESGGVFSSTVNNDGWVMMHVLEDGKRPEEIEHFYFMDRPPAEGAGVSQGTYVWKGPSDSRRYLCVYGIRYHGRDPEFMGLGYRFAPTKDGGYLPFGFDGAPLEHLGFQMIQASEYARSDMISTVNLQQVSASGVDNILTFDHGGLVDHAVNGTAVNGSNPLFETQAWQGLGGTSVQPFNDEALRGYRVAILKNAAAPWPGARFTLNQVTTPLGSSIAISTLNETVIPATLTNRYCVVYPFRWNQREVIVCNVRHYSEPRYFGVEFTYPAVLSAAIGPTYYPPPSLAATFHTTQQLTIYYPRGPRPAKGWPVLFVCLAGSFLQSNPTATLDVAATRQRTPHNMVTHGWAVVVVGVTGVDSVGLPGNGFCIFYPQGHAKYSDYSANANFWFERDLTWARQYLELHKHSLGLDTDRVVGVGRSSSGIGIAYTALGPTRKLTAANLGLQVRQDDHFAGFVWEAPVPHLDVFLASNPAGHWENAVTPDTPGPTIGACNKDHLHAGSASYILLEPGARGNTIPVFLLTGEFPVYQEFSFKGDGSPYVTGVVDGLAGSPVVLHTWSTAILFWRQLTQRTSPTHMTDLPDLGNQRFHYQQSELVACLDTITGLSPTGFVSSVNQDQTQDLAGTIDSAVVQDAEEQWLLDTFQGDEANRVAYSLSTSVDLQNPNDPGIEKLVAYWPCDDSGGAVVRELIAGNDGYFFPFGLGNGKRGQRGKDTVFLSGEGEAVCYDLSENPVFMREFENLLRSGAGGFAVEFTGILPEAYYGVDDVGTPRSGMYGPTIASWEVKDFDGSKSRPRPIATLTHRAYVTGAGAEAFFHPLGLSLLVDTGDDQDNASESVAVYGWPALSTSNFDLDAPWVGRPITVQFGIESTGTPGQFNAYVAMRTKDLFQPEAGDPSGAEFAYYSTFSIKAKDLVRSVITIGGRWDPDPAGKAHGYTEMNCRMILDEVRIFGASAPGGLPAVSGDPITDGNGKLCGKNAYPARGLTRDDILQELGSGVRSVAVEEGSTTVTAPGTGRFWTAEPEDATKAVKETYLILSGDSKEVSDGFALPDVFQEFYYVSAVDASGLTLTTSNPIATPTNPTIGARSFRLIGYTDFSAPPEPRELALGAGRAFAPGTSTTDDAVLSEPLWDNLAPVDAGFRLRIYSPFGRGSATGAMPRWVRGLAIERENPILGLTSWGDRTFGGVQGSLYEFDDRWRQSHPTDQQAVALAFLAKRYPGSGVLLPLHDDWVHFTGVASGDASVTFDATALGQYAFVFDARVQLDEIGEIQTIAWVGDPDTNPALSGSTKKVAWWMRFERGRPQLVVASTQNYLGGTTPPPEGFYVATANYTMRPGERKHIRWVLWAAGGFVKAPACAVEGKYVGVSLNARGTTVSADDDWFSASTIVASAAAEMFVGAARHSYVFPDSGQGPTMDNPKGNNIVPQRIQGMLHSLAGELSEFVISRAINPASAPGDDSLADFIPYELEYDDLRFRIFLIVFPFGPGAPHGGVRPVGQQFTRTELFATLESSDQVGVGPRAYDSVGDRYGTIHSHPAISLFHEAGQSDEPYSFATLENRIYATNGDRPAYIDPDTRGAGFVGVLRPAVAPTHTIERLPVWENDEAAGTGFLGQVASGVQPKRKRFLSHGNNYFRQPWHSEIAWEKDGTNFDTYAFKAVIEPFDVDGRIQLRGARSGAEQGPVFVEIRDGKLAVGWYDTEQKKELWVETDKPVFVPGFVHYVYVRKRFPSQDSTSGNWINSVKQQTSGFTYDSAVVRRFMRVAADSTYSNWPRIGAKSGTAARSCISFTTSTQVIAACTATGLVSSSTQTYTTTGGADGIVNSAAASFHGDMAGMDWQWDPVATGDSTVYRIVSVTSTAQIIVRNPTTGALPTFGAAYNNRQGGVFSGITLVKSEGFDDSASPDSAAYPTEVFGSASSAELRSSIRPFRGRVWSFAQHVQSAAGNGQAGTGANILVFESGGAALADDIEIGTDFWDALIFTGGSPPGALMADAGNTFASVHTIAYSGSPKAAVTTTQPSENGLVSLSAQSSVNASPFQLRFVQEIDVLSGRRNVAVVFFDPLQGQLSNPSPILEVQPPEEDRSNPSARTRILLENLPVSSQGSQVERWIYVSAADGQYPLRVAILSENDSGAFALDKTELQIGQGQPLQYDNDPPPRSLVLASDSNAIFYGGLVDLALDGYVPSKPGYAGSVLVNEFRRMFFGGGDRITALASFKGRVLVSKRDAIMRVLYRDGGVPVEELVTQNAGVPGPQAMVVHDDYVAFVNPPFGVYIYDGSRAPFPVNKALRPVFSGKGPFPVDPAYFSRISTAMSRTRSQLLIAFRSEGDKYARDRVSCELLQASNFRYSRYLGPNVTALASVLRRGGGAEVVVAGTQEGFVLHMDRLDAQHQMRGSVEAEWGTLELTAGGLCNEREIGVAGGTPDLVLENVRGQQVRWKDSDGTERMAVALLATPTAIHLDAPSDVIEPGNTFSIGAIRHQWDSGWMDLGDAFESEKRPRRLDIIFEPRDDPDPLSDHVLVQLFVDQDLSEPRLSKTLTISEGAATFDINELKGRYFLVRIVSDTPASGEFFDLSHLAVRFSDADQQ